MPSISCVDKVEIKAPVSLVFDVVSDYENWHSWIPIYKCEVMGGQKIQEGSHVIHRHGYRPLILSKFTRSINNIKPNNRIEESYISGDLKGSGIWHFEAQGSHTIAAYECNVNSNSWLSHISFFLLGENAHKNIYKPLLQLLKQHCESVFSNNGNCL